MIHIYRTLAELSGLKAPDYVDGVSLVPQLTDPACAVDQPAITTWGRGNYSIRSKDWRYIRYYDGSEELYDHRDDPQEWTNLAEDPKSASPKARLAQWLPEDEAPLVREGISLWNVVDADQPEKLANFRKQFRSLNQRIEPRLIQDEGSTLP